MATQAFLILDAAEKAAAEALNDENEAVNALPINNALADNLGHGPLNGLRYILPARILNDPLYARWVPVLGQKNIRVMDSDTLFAPFIDEE